MVRITLELPDHVLTKMRSTMLSAAESELRSALSHGDQREPRTPKPESIASACQNYLTLYKGLQRPYEPDQRGN